MKFLIIFLVSFKSFAHMDLSVGGAARTYPAIGAEVSGAIGYNHILWGKSPKDETKKNPLYGIIRPILSASSSVVVNSYDARLEVYPISFMGLVAGRAHTRSDFEKFPFFDCEKVRCKGTMDRDYFMFKMALGHKSILAVGNVSVSRNQYNDPTGENLPVGEFRFATLASPGSDQMYRSQYILGYKLSSDDLIGVVAEYVEFADANQSHNMDLLVYSTKKKDTTYIWGLGQFSSTHQPKGLIMVLQWRSDIMNSSVLF
jgi:hypothetical protein